MDGHKMLVGTGRYVIAFLTTPVFGANDCSGVFVSNEHGSDATGSGTKEAPYASITKGLSGAAGKKVFVCLGPKADYTGARKLDEAESLRKRRSEDSRGEALFFEQPGRRLTDELSSNEKARASSVAAAQVQWSFALRARDRARRGSRDNVEV